MGGILLLHLLCVCVVQFPLHSSVYLNSKADVYCYEGSFWIVSPFVRFWDYLHVVVTTDAPKLLRVTYGNSSKAVLKSKLYTIHNFTSSNPILLSPYKVHCVVVQYMPSGPNKEVSYSLHTEFRVYWYFPLLFVAGCVLLFAAPAMSRSVPLLYGAGVTIGILGSALILLYVVSRFIPGVGGV